MGRTNITEVKLRSHVRPKEMVERESLLVLKLWKSITQGWLGTCWQLPFGMTRSNMPVCPRMVGEVVLGWSSGVPACISGPCHDLVLIYHTDSFGLAPRKPILEIWQREWPGTHRRWRRKELPQTYFRRLPRHPQPLGHCLLWTEAAVNLLLQGVFSKYHCISGP